MNLVSPELLDKARSLPHPTAAETTGLALPSQQELEDAHWQQEHAGQQLAEFVASMRQRLATPPDDTPAARARYERNAAFLRTLEYFLITNAALITLLDEREETMRESMADAQFTYHQLMLDRSFFQHEARGATQRLYTENDLAKLLTARTSPSYAA